MRLRKLRGEWIHDARSEALAVQEWRASMENRPPLVTDGMERGAANLSTHDMERLIDEAFHIVVNMSAADGPEEYDRAVRDGLHVFDRLRERYGLPSDDIDGWDPMAGDTFDTQRARSA